MVRERDHRECGFNVGRERESHIPVSRPKGSDKPLTWAFGGWVEVSGLEPPTSTLRT
jgi:hypothetical protein